MCPREAGRPVLDESGINSLNLDRESEIYGRLRIFQSMGGVIQGVDHAHRN
jgi:hypothetical protein